MARPTFATIHADALRHNLAVLRAVAPASRLMAVVKADGYGHGLERVARSLSSADAFGVASLSDAERLRAAGHEHPIVLLSGFDAPEDLPRMSQLSVQTVVHDANQLEMLGQATALAAPIRCWLKVDTGMHRLGFAPEEVREAHSRLEAMPSVDAEVVLMTHFASSDALPASTADDGQTRAQLNAFAASTEGLAGPRSLANSAAVLGWPQSHGDWIRPGGALFGMSVVAGSPGAAFGLRPAMTLGTRLLAVKRIRRGERVGYGGAWTCPEDMPIGVAAIGYGDGYPRLAPAGTPALVDGRPARVIGRVSMDLMTLDLRDCPAAVAGAPVTLWGTGLPIETVAESAGTIAYELSCSVTRRVRFIDD
ncbi:alanine racemase [Luteimonas vadosa]|uniref:Alanine racemase n=1 Tax=Luteimonas vadosa TaxID=1165507 RepID=A0ABP9E293_9GAMM